MNWNPILRRQFLRGAGKAALALPLLPSLLPRELRAQTLGTQKSFIGFPLYNHLPAQYNSSEAEAKAYPSVFMPPRINMKPVAGVARHTIYTKTLAEALADSPSGRVSALIDSSFNSMLPKMTMLQGLDYTYKWAHHSGQFGNGNATATAEINAINPQMVNIDQVLAYSPSFYKNANLIGKYVHFTGTDVDVNFGGHYYTNTFTYTNPSDQVKSPIVATSPISKPAALWDKFFAQFTPPPPPTGGVVKDPRKTLVDAVLGDYNNVLKGTRLGADDRKRMERHVQLLQDTEKNLGTLNANCTKPARPTPTDIKTTLQAHNDVITSLIACGLCHSFLARIQCFLTSNADDWHAWSHDDAAASQALLKQQVQAVTRDAALDLAKKLDAQGLLDNSLVVLPWEHGRRGHIGIGAGAVLFGSGGGVIKTGNYIDYMDPSSTTELDVLTGYPINQLMANVLMALDVPATEFEKLNRSQNAFFTPSNSGYGANGFFVDGNGTDYPASWNPKMKGLNMSDWLPLLKA